MSYDPKCHDLAKAFLADYPAADAECVKSLAQWVQDAVEDWFRMEEANLNAGTPELPSRKKS